MSGWVCECVFVVRSECVNDGQCLCSVGGFGKHRGDAADCRMYLNKQTQCYRAREGVTN